MIVSMLISGFVVAGAFSGFNIYRQTFVQDQSRREVNQSLTGISSLIEPDILQIGQGLTDDPNFETVRVVQTDIPGTTEQSSVITITKAIVSAALPICDDITAGTSTNRIMVMDDVKYDEDGDPDPINGQKKSGCQLVDTQPSNSPDGDGWPDILKVFRDNRINQGGTIKAYIYAGEILDADGNKVNNYQTFNYTGEITENADGNSMTPSPGNPPARAFITTDGNTWDYDYSSVGTGRINIIERRTYFLDRQEGEDSGTLKVIIDPPQSVVDGDLSGIDSDDVNVLSLAEGIANFEVTVSLLEDVNDNNPFGCKLIPPPPTADPVNCPFPPGFQYSWANIQSIETKTTLYLDEKDLTRNRLTEDDLVLTERFFPRSVFSF